MQWLLHGSLTPAVAAALIRHEHKVHTLAELGVDAGMILPDLLRAVEDKQWEIISNDPAMGHDIFEAQIRFARTIVFLQLPGGEAEQENAVDRLFARYRRLAPRRLYTVTGSRVKIRQLPGATFG